jgi:hypothetical protein
MKRFYGLTLVVALLIATVYLTMRPVKATALEQSDCSQATLQGTYPFLAPATIVVSQGTVIAVPEAYLYASPAAYASRGTVTFDGNGYALMEATADRHGEVATPVTHDSTYWEDLATFFAYPAEIRRLIYTTNAIEGYNRGLRKVVKTKSSFPTPEAARKLLYLANQNITKTWTVPNQNWANILNQLVIRFAGRLPI